MFIVAFVIPVLVAVCMVFASLVVSRVSRQARIPYVLLALHGIFVVATVVPSLFGRGGLDFPYEDVYGPFFLYPGVIFAYVNIRVATLFQLWLVGKVGDVVGGYLCIVAIPAFLTTVIGAVFWMISGRLVERVMGSRA